MLFPLPKVLVTRRKSAGGARAESDCPALGQAPIVRADPRREDTKAEAPARAGWVKEASPNLRKATGKGKDSKVPRSLSGDKKVQAKAKRMHKERRSNGHETMHEAHDHARLDVVSRGGALVKNVYAITGELQTIVPDSLQIPWAVL